MQLGFFSIVCYDLSVTRVDKKVLYWFGVPVRNWGTLCLRPMVLK